AEQVVVADVEEEVAGAGIVPVLDQLDQRESKELLVEADRLLDVAADQGQVMDPGGGGGRPLGDRPEVAFPQPLPPGPDLLQLSSLWLRHDPSRLVAGPGRRQGIVRDLGRTGGGSWPGRTARAGAGPARSAAARWRTPGRAGTRPAPGRPRPPPGSGSAGRSPAGRRSGSRGPAPAGARTTRWGSAPPADPGT